MPGLNLVFPSKHECPYCGNTMAVPQARSHLVSRNKAIVLFNDARPPKTLYIVLVCANGHPSGLPADAGIEWWFQSPTNAPIGCDAVVLGYNTATYHALRALAIVVARGWIVWFVALAIFYLGVNDTLHPRPLWIGIGLTGVVLSLLLRLPAWQSYYIEAVRANFVRLGES